MKLFIINKEQIINTSVYQVLIRHQILEVIPVANNNPVLYEVKVGFIIKSVILRVLS